MLKRTISMKNQLYSPDAKKMLHLLPPPTPKLYISPSKKIFLLATKTHCPCDICKFERATGFTSGYSSQTCHNK